jgi:hypothetical protein
MMRLAYVERLGELLLAVPALADTLIAEDPRAPEQITSWLEAVEQQLAAQDLPTSASFASLRTRLWSVGHGLRLPALQITKTSSARNWRRVGTSAILDEATQMLNNLVAPERAMVAEASGALRQAVELGRIREHVGGHSLPWHAPDELWFALLTDPDLMVFVTRAASAVGEVDAQTLLGRAAAAGAHPLQQLNSPVT